MPQAKNLDLNSQSLPTDRALGIHWNVERDTIDFVVSNKEQPNNRKTVLSSVAALFDPLGFASPLLLPGKEINQELCKLKFDWNHKLPEELCLLWSKWRAGLTSLEGFGIPDVTSRENLVKSNARNFIILLMLLKNMAMGQLPICVSTMIKIKFIAVL